MALWLRSTEPGFAEDFAAFLTTKREISEDVDRAVRDIISAVRANGDTALIDLSRRFDRIELTAETLAVSVAEVDEAVANADPEVVAALKLARDRIESHHSRQMPKDDRYTDAIGVELGSRWTAIESVGLYVPGGTASYPSSVLMNAVPARVAGVERIVMVVPSLRSSISCTACIIRKFPSSVNGR